LQSQREIAGGFRAMTKETKILLVDDETNIRLMLRFALASVGYDVIEAVNGAQALDATEKFKPDVMLLDLSMPVLDGMGVLTQLQASPAEHKPRVIVLTAYGSISAAVKATRLGAMDFLEKPVLPDEVRQSVKAVLAESLLKPHQRSEEENDGYAGVLARARKALRLEEFTSAETLLMRAADLGTKDAAYFNLLGVLYEAQDKWHLAKKFYGKSIKENRSYQPAQQNMRRIYELYTFGKSAQAPLLGDENQMFAWRDATNAKGAT
jgi:DNA-binding response OmpR family regulator